MRLTVRLLFIHTVAMIKIAGVKSNDKINFREFVDFFNKVIVELGERNSDLEEKTMKLHEKATKD